MRIHSVNYAVMGGSDGDFAETSPAGASDYLACDDLEMVLLFEG